MSGRKAVKNKLALIIIPLLAFFVSCGLEDYYYLPPIPQSSPFGNTEGVSRATITLPDNYGSYSYFHTFKILYRIYISGTSTVARVDNKTLIGEINSTLLSDFNSIEPSTDTTSTTVNTSVGSLFTNRRYQELALENTDIDNVLAAGQTIVLDFTETTIPALEIGETGYPLYRSNGEGLFEPDPDRYFRNTPEICLSASTNTTLNINNDVADTSASTPASPRYTYASFYIVATGVHPANLTTIYSSPAFIGILRLPDAL